eukprot:scaffold766_cov185-Chaetoceros_neogracile.AAC.4
MEYRQRTGLLLEAALRVAGSVRSYRLYKTIVECVTMFKIGTTTASEVGNQLQCKALSHALLDPESTQIFRRYSSNPMIRAIWQKRAENVEAMGERNAKKEEGNNGQV